MEGDRERIARLDKTANRVPQSPSFGLSASPKERKRLRESLVKASTPNALPDIPASP